MNRLRLFIIEEKIISNISDVFIFRKVNIYQNFNTRNNIILFSIK